MEWLDRYLREVSFLLPRAARRDIIAELTEDFHSQIEAREAELGRPVDDDDAEAILKRWGHPLLVAQRYLPQQYLIGPVLFPVYKLVLKIVFLVYPLPWLLVWLGFVLFDPGYRANPELLGTLTPLWRTMILLFAVVTAVFALVERHQTGSRSLERWSPRKLPAAPDPKAMSRATAIAEALMYGLMTLWWAGVFDVFPTGPEVTIAVSPAAELLSWPVLCVLVALTTLSAVNAFKPYWSKQRLTIRLALDAACVVLIAALLSTGRLIVVSGSDVPAGVASTVAGWIHLGWTIMLAAAGVTYLLRCLQDVRRLSGKGPIRHWVMHALGAD